MSLSLIEDVMNVRRKENNIQMPQVKPSKKESKVKRVYEDDSWVIDLIDGNVRVSYFEDNHFVDETIVFKDFFEEVDNE